MIERKYPIIGDTIYTIDGGKITVYDDVETRAATKTEENLIYMIEWLIGDDNYGI